MFIKKGHENKMQKCITYKIDCYACGTFIGKFRILEKRGFPTLLDNFPNFLSGYESNTKRETQIE